MNNVNNIILQDDPTLLNNTLFKSSLLRFAIENHCFNVASFMQDKHFVPPPVTFDKNKVLDCEKGKLWIYKNELYDLVDIFNYDLNPELLNKWVFDKFIKKYATLEFLLNGVTFISERHYQYLFKNLKPQILPPTFIENCSQDVLLNFLNKGYTIETPEYINTKYDKIWTKYISCWTTFNDETKNNKFIQIAEKCNRRIFDKFIDIVILNFDILYALLLRVNKNNNTKLMKSVEKYVIKAKNEINYQEFATWYCRRRKAPTNNHDIYILIKNGYNINKKLQHIATTVYLIKKCYKQNLNINDKSIIEFIENNSKKDIIKGIKVINKMNIKINTSTQQLLDKYI